mgnify:CR=1 FL=1
MQNDKGNKRYWIWISTALVFLLLLLLTTISMHSVRNLIFGGPLSSSTYSIGDTSLVDGITVRQGEDSVDITRSSHGWSIQDRPAGEEAISTFLGAFLKVEVFSPIPRLVDSVLEAKLRSSEAIVVRLTKEGKIYRQLSLLYTDTLGLGTVALSYGSTSGAVVRTNENGTKLFYLVSPRPSFWINSKLFTIPMEKITFVTFTNHQWPDSSFSFRLQGDSFQLLGSKGAVASEKVDSKAISRYLIYLSRASVLGVASNIEQPREPLYTIRVESSMGNETVKYIPLPPPSALDEAGHPAQFDYNRLLVRRNGTD